MPPVDKFEGQPALGYTAKEQGEEAKAEERAGGIGSQMKEERETCRSLTEHHSVEADISLHCLPVMSEFKPFVLRSFHSCGLRGYGDRVCRRVYESYQRRIETCQGPAPDHVTSLKDVSIPEALESYIIGWPLTLRCSHCLRDYNMQCSLKCYFQCLGFIVIHSKHTFKEFGINFILEFNIFDEISLISVPGLMFEWEQIPPAMFNM